MPRKVFVLSVVLAVLAVASSASANGPIREEHQQGDVVLRGQCAFPVLGHIDGIEIIKTFVDAAGDPFKQIVTFPANQITLTNVRSGVSITVMGTGSSQLRARSDGSVSARAMGHGLFFPNPITGEPGIWYLSGQGVATLDQNGETTEAILHGRLVDLCSRLAS